MTLARPTDATIFQGDKDSEGEKMIRWTVEKLHDQLSESYYGGVYRDIECLELRFIGSLGEKHGFEGS